jgi:sensor histidine kinase YesM
MEHPFLKNTKILFIYTAIWVLICIIHFAILNYFYAVKALPAFIDSILFNFLFWILGVSVWYIVKYLKPSKLTPFNMAINHITAITILLLVIISLGISVLNISFSHDYVYCAFLNKSIAWRTVSGLFYYSILALIYYIIIYYNDLQERTSHEANLKEMIKTAELDLLKSQINPHFLFNSLNSISSLTITSPEKAQTMIIKLSDFLRYSITPSSSVFSTLKMELENINHYLDIEQVRFENKLIYENKIDEDCLNKKLPAMILQPLYENALKHGVYESTEPIKILTICKMEGNSLSIKISNNVDAMARNRKGAGIGLKNIIDRMKLIYGSGQLLKTNKTANVFTAEMIIPQIEN